MKRLGWVLLLLFFFPSSSNPLQNPFQPPLQNSPVSGSKELDQNADSLNKIGFEEVIKGVRLQGHAGGHGVGGHGGGGHSDAGGFGGGGGAMSHHNNDKDNRHVRGANSCPTNHIGFVRLAFLVLPFLFLM